MVCDPIQENEYGIKSTNESQFLSDDKQKKRVKIYYQIKNKNNKK